MCAIFLVACATTPETGEEFVEQDEWLKAVIEYRKRLAEQPGDVEVKSQLHQLELRAADYYYHRGLRLAKEGSIESAINEYQQGLMAKPDYPKLAGALRDVLARKEAASLYAEAMRNRAAGKNDEALRILERALKLVPGHSEAASAVVELRQAREGNRENELVLGSSQPIDLNFRKTDLRAAFEFIGKAFGINVLFDGDAPNSPVTLFAENVTFEQALQLMTATTKTFYKRIGRNTILITPDTKEKRGQYEDYYIRIFHLRTAQAKEMANLLKGLLSLKKVIVNEELNSLIVRDKRQVLELVGKLVAVNDRKPAEAILEVEILEVNRNKSEQLGFDFGSEISVKFDPFTVSGSWGDGLGEGVISFPSVAFRYFKQDVDAKTLANPKIRVLDNKPAKIHIGDRVPLRASTILDATGQTRTTFEYRDIGIRLTAQPSIHLDNSVTVKLGLEVSTLGQNLGTPQEPAFSIGTRNTETHMLLRDGETAILGGLIRDEDRNSRIKIPGLGEIPAIGSLFRSRDGQSGRTDVLLTITPRVVRAWDFSSDDARDMYSGTSENYSDRPAFSTLLAGNEDGDMPVPLIRTDAAHLVEKPVEKGGGRPPKAAVENKKGNLQFDQAAYAVNQGEEITVEIRGENLAGINELPIGVLLNPELLEIVGATPGDLPGVRAEINADPAAGTIVMNVAPPEDGMVSNAGVLAQVRLKGLKPGISYLVFRSLAYTTGDGNAVTPQVRASRIIVR